MLRSVTALVFELQATGFRAVVVRPEAGDQGAQFEDVTQTWLTLRRGDSYRLRGIWNTIAEVILYDVSPASHNGRTVNTAQEWLDESD